MVQTCFLKSGLCFQHSPMSKLITSTQSCSYQFDRRERHITTASCTENHSYRPLFHT